VLGGRLPPKKFGMDWIANMAVLPEQHPTMLLPANWPSRQSL